MWKKQNQKDEVDKAKRKNYATGLDICYITSRFGLNQPIFTEEANFQSETLPEILVRPDCHDSWHVTRERQA